MLRHALSLLLVASITSCPLICNLNGALAKATGGAPHACCECCHDEHPGKSETVQMLPVYLRRRDYRNRQRTRNRFGLERLDISSCRIDINSPAGMHA
jgi:hypothetical protein